MPAADSDHRNPFRDFMNERPLLDGQRIRPWVWTNRASECRAFRSVNHTPFNTVAKIKILRYIWIALARNVESRTVRNEYGVVVSDGWSRQDFLGMMDWYRAAFHLPGWWVTPENDYQQRAIDNSHHDGVWLTTLFTSPWFNRPEFAAIKGENDRPGRDAQGYLCINPYTGLPRYFNRNHESDDALQGFLDMWVYVANSVPVPLDQFGDVVCGVIPYRFLAAQVALA